MTLTELLDARFGGVLRYGPHSPDGECCALELLSAYRGCEWTENPTMVRCFDIRPLNDAPWPSDADRTRAMLPLLSVLDGSLDWPEERQRRFISTVVIETVRRIIADLPGLSDEVRQQCRSATTLSEAAWAAAGYWRPPAGSG